MPQQKEILRWKTRNYVSFKDVQAFYENIDFREIASWLFHLCITDQLDLFFKFSNILMLIFGCFDMLNM